MLSLNANSRIVLRAKRTFYAEMLDEIYKRIDKINLIDPIKYGINVSVAERLFDLHVIPHLEDILIGSPRTLEKVNTQINPFIKASSDLKIAVKYVFDYDGWFVNKTKDRYGAYHLASSLNASTCTYCNRNYTNTVVTIDGNKIETVI